MRHFRNLRTLLLVAALPALVFAAYGCQTSTPVANINLCNASLYETEHPPTGAWMSFPSGPYNDSVYSFDKSEEILIYIQMESELEAPVNFTKFTFYNKETGEEVTIEPMDDLGPFEAEDGNTWHAQTPDEDGEYELRVYIDKRVVASALLNTS